MIEELNTTTSELKLSELLQRIVRLEAEMADLKEPHNHSVDSQGLVGFHPPIPSFRGRMAAGLRPGNHGPTVL